jgi:four helix bundle protein
VDAQPAKFECRLIVWQRAVDLCVAVSALTLTFPREEIYGLSSQMRRASVSIPSNIAEGYGRTSRDQYSFFLGIAQGSYLELQTQLVIAGRLALAATSQIERVQNIASEVGKMLSAILRKLRRQLIF